MLIRQSHGWMLLIFLLLIGCSQQGDKAVDNEQPIRIIEAPTSPPEISQPEIAEPEVNEPVEEIADSEIIEPVEEIADSEIVEPVEEIADSEIIEPVEEIADSEIIEPVEEIADSEIIEPVEEIAAPEIIDVEDDIIPDYPRFPIKVIHNDVFAPNKLISLGIEITNILAKRIEYFDGHIIIYDNYNNLLGSLNFVENNILKLNFFRHRYVLKPQQTKVWGLGIREEESYDFYHSLLDKPASDIKAEFIVTSIKYADGTEDVF
jgi:hypothetical protein